MAQVNLHPHQLPCKLIMFQSMSVQAVLTSFTETWFPRLVASVNDHHVNAAKVDGEFIWHAHPESEELFYLLSGKLRMQIEGQDTVAIKEGDLFVVPKGVRQRLVAKNAYFMIVEPQSTINTGDQEGSERTKQICDVRADIQGS